MYLVYITDAAKFQFYSGTIRTSNELHRMKKHWTFVDFLNLVVNLKRSSFNRKFLIYYTKKTKSGLHDLSSYVFIEETSAFLQGVARKTSCMHENSAIHAGKSLLKGFCKAFYSLIIAIVCPNLIKRNYTASTHAWIFHKSRGSSPPKYFARLTKFYL